MLSGLAVAVTGLALLVPAAPAAAATETRTITYGSFTVPAGGGDPHNHDTMGHLNKVQDVEKPCSGCTITSITPSLVHADGSPANWDTGATLHHALFIARGNGKTDTTCGSTFGGERFYATGNERKPFDVRGLPYGYKVAAKNERWKLNIDLMNWATTAQDVRLQITYTYATGGDSTALKPLTPVWLGHNNCGNSEYEVPNGESDTHLDWTSTVTGNIIRTSGHVHDHGIGTQLTNESLGGALICESLASYGGPGYESPDGRKHVSAMGICSGDPLATVNRGQVLRLHSLYNVPATHHPVHDAMGIMTSYVHKTG